MGKIFTDDSGKKWEAVDYHDLFSVVIKPIPASPTRWLPKKGEKYYYFGMCLDIRWDVHNGQFIKGDFNYFRTEEQAQAVADAIKVLLEFLHTKIDGGKSTTEVNNRMTKTIRKARKLIQPDRGNHE